MSTFLHGDMCLKFNFLFMSTVSGKSLHYIGSLSFPLFSLLFFQFARKSMHKLFSLVSILCISRVRLRPIFFVFGVALFFFVIFINVCRADTFFFLLWENIILLSYIHVVECRYAYIAWEVNTWLTHTRITGKLQTQTEDIKLLSW